jgi:hypothetical protein
MRNGYLRRPAAARGADTIGWGLGAARGPPATWNPFAWTNEGLFNE